jgi:hypothetical protein
MERSEKHHEQGCVIMVTDRDVKSDLLKRCAKALFYLGQDGPHRTMLKSDEITAIAQGRANFLKQLEVNNIHKALEHGGSHLIERTEQNTVRQIKSFIGLLHGVRTDINFDTLDDQLTGIVTAYKILGDELRGDTTAAGIAAATYAAEVEACFESIHEAVISKSWETQKSPSPRKGRRGGGETPGRDRR